MVLRVAEERAIWSKTLFLFVLAISMVGCKTAKKISDLEGLSSLPAKTIITEHYKNTSDFQTLSGKVKIEYANGGSVQSVGVSLRMEKDKAIWISAPLGVIKAYITPERVSFYNKLQNEYFDGDFKYLSDLLGTDLDFFKIQSLLLGEAFVDLRDGKYQSGVNGSEYELKPRREPERYKPLFYIEPGNFKISRQLLSDPTEKRLLDIKYKDYQQKGPYVIPNHVGILAIDTNERTLIDITYKNIEFDRELNFPYRIPKGYDEIVVK